MKGRWSNETNKQEPVKTGRWSADVAATRQRTQEAASRPVQRQPEPVQRDTHETVMDMAINSLRNRMANSNIAKGMGEWTSRVSGNIQNVLNESPEVRAARRQARADQNARRQQFAIDTANLIDQASAQYEGPTRTETVRATVADTDNADLFSNDWEPGATKDVEYTRTVRNENYNPLSREERDALISRYADAMNGKTDANGYQQVLYDVTKNGGIKQLYAEQQADAANDREYGRQLRGVDLDNMNFWQRLGGTLGGTFAGAGEQIASSGVGLAVSGLNREAGIATQEFGPALEQTARRWFYALANGAEDDPAVEEQIRTLASYVGVDADTLVGRIKDRAEQARNSDEDIAAYAYGLLDGLEADQDQIWKNAQQAIADAGFYDAINNLQQKSAEHIQYAKDVNLLQNQFGDNLVEAGVSTIQNAADAAMAATLGLSGTGVIAMIPFALRAYGGSYAEQMQQATELGGVIGQDVAKKAAQSAGISSAIEVGTEMMWGMVGAMSKVTGGGALDDAAQQKLTEILSGWAKTETGRKILTTVGEKALGGITEGLEEVIGDAAEQILKNAGIMPGEGEEWSEWVKNAGHSFITGALGGLMGEVTGLVSSPMQQSQIGKQLKAGGLDISLSELADLANSEGMENTSLAKAYSDVFSGMPRNIENISDLEAGKLYTAYEEMLGKRSDALDRIEQMQAKVEAGEELTRADVNRITNNSDAVAILAESGAVSEDAFSGGINERRDAVEMALRAFANDSTALSETDAENVQAETENANTAVSAPNPFLTMSNSAIDNIVRNAQPMSPAQSIRESNAGNMLAGNVLRSAARVVDAAERLNVSERGQDVMARMYSPNMDAIDYVGEMTKYYNQGKEGKTFDVGSIEGVSAIQAQAAFNAGRQEYIERSNNGEEGLRVRTSSERQNGQGAGGSAGVLEESTGTAQGRQTGSFQREGGNARVSAESLRTEGARAIERSGLRIVTNDSSVAAAKKYAEDRGVNFVAYAGGALNIDGVQSRGYYDPDTNTVYVRADHRLFTAEQIAKHETTHAQIHNGKITLGEVDRETVDFATVRDALVKELTQERFDEMVDAYVEMYAGTNLSRQDIFEELICDSVAGMNDFVSVGHLENAVKFAPSMSKAKAIAEAQEANGTRAGPVESGGWQRYSADQYDPETAGIKEQIANATDKLNAMAPIASITVPANIKTNRDAAEWAIDLLKKTGYQIDRQGYGKILFGEKDIRNGARYATNNAERAAFAAVPSVLKRGVEIGRHNDHKARSVQTITFAGPVVMNGVRGNMAVVINSQGSHYKTHRIVMPDGTTFILEDTKKEDLQRSRGVAENSSLAETTRSSTGTVAEENDSVKENIEEAAKEFGDSGEYNSEAGGSFSRELDPDKLRELNSGKTMTVYRSMQLIKGKLYPPMAAKIDDGSGKRKLVEPTAFDEWYRADEHPELLDKEGKFKLDKANGSTLDVAYNPYWHTSNMMLNDQFSSAYKRKNLVTVECEIPVSELTSGYKAQYAKDAVGLTPWHSGPVASQLGNAGNQRNVYLSRWVKVKRIVPDTEVAKSIAKTLNDTGITVPVNTVTPSLRAELEKIGVPISEASGLKKAAAEKLNATLNPAAYLPKTAAEAKSRYDGTDSAYGIDQNGGKFSLDSMEKDILDKKFQSDLTNKLGWEPGRVNALVKSLNELMDYIKPNRDILDLNEEYTKETRPYSPYKPNSDPLYKISLDYSTLCRKRLMTQYIIEKLQLREHRPMSGEEQIAIRDMLKEYRQIESGLQVACAMCYVEAARLKSPDQMNRYFDDPEPVLKNYFAQKNKAYKRKVENLQKKWKTDHGYEATATKKEMTPADVAAFNEYSSKVRHDYNPATDQADAKRRKEELAAIERAKNLSPDNYLSAENLANLKEQDPLVYDAYTSNIRAATRSKGLETDVPYYYGDSRRKGGPSDKFIKNVNAENGMRFSSWSDFQFTHLLDQMMAVIDLSVRKAAMHGYTKFPEQVRIFGKTGAMFNMSGVPDATGLNSDGSLRFSPTESIDIEEARRLRDQFPETAGVQCIGISDEHVKALLRSDFIDYVIPYHVSGLNAVLRQMVKIASWQDYTGSQEESVIDSKAKWEDSDRKCPKDKWHKGPVFSEFFDPAWYTDPAYKGKGVDAMREAAKRYVQMCADRGMRPKFTQFLGEENYWKLLIDRKMVNQKTGDLIQQKPVTPDFDFDVIKKEIADYVEKTRAEQGIEDRAFDYVAEHWDEMPGRIAALKQEGAVEKNIAKAEERKRRAMEHQANVLGNEMYAAAPKNVAAYKYSRDLDSAGNKLSAQQAEYFKDSKVRDKDGSLLVMYHGTDANFNIFDFQRGGEHGTAEGFGIYLADDRSISEHYGGRIIESYANITRPARSDTKTIKSSELTKLIKAACLDEAKRMAEDYGGKVTDALRDTWVSNYVYTYDKSMDAVYREVANNILRLNDNDMDIVQEVMAGMAIRTYDAAMAFYNDILTPTTGIDGFITHWSEQDSENKHLIALAFNSNQVKNTDNQNPTENPDIRYSRDLSSMLPDNADETAKKVVENLSRKAKLNDMAAKYGSFKSAAYTDERIAQEIEYSYATGERSKDYARAYIAFVSPGDFIDATSSRSWRGNLYQQVADKAKEEGRESMLDLDALQNERQSMFLRIEATEDGRASIVGHEGRHRMIGLEKEGYKYVPVIIEPREGSYPDGQSRYSTKPIDMLWLNGQEFGAGNGTSFVLHDILPLSANYADIAKEIFAGGQNVTKFSRDLSNTELYEANRQLQKDLTELRSKLKTRTEQYKYWKGQTKVTEGRQLRIEDVTKLAREIIKGQESSADAKAVAEKMKALGEYLLNSQDENVYDEARLKAYEVAHDILANAKALNTKGGDDFYSDFRTALKNQAIYVAPSVREEVAPDGWNDFRKAQFGTVNMTADQSKGKSVDTVYHDLQATFGEWLLPEYITSEADQLNKILEVIETYRPVYENLNSYEMADAVEWTANEILTRIIGEEIRETNPTYADRMEKKLADQKAKAQTALKQVRQQRDRKVADLKAHYQQVAEDRRNRKIDSENRSRLLKIAKRLNNKKLDRVTRGLLDQYIGELDLVSKGILDRTIKDIEHLNDFYNAYKEKMGADFIEDISIKNRIDRLSKKHINDLTQEEVAELTTVLLNFENMLRTKDKLLESQIKKDVYAAGMQTIDDIANSNGKTGFLAEYIGAETASPERYIRRITGYRENSPLYQAAKELSDGQRKMLDYQMRAEALFKKWTTDKKFIRSIAGKHAEAITARGYVDGAEKELNITPAMAMSLYLHAKNDDNMRHISQGGVMIPNMELYLKGKLPEAYAKGERVVFTRSMIAKITAQLDEKEKAFADAVGRYYNTMSRDEINDVSEILKGFAIAGVENYFPIDTNGNFLAKTFDTIKRDGSIEGMGFLKERIDNASTPIMLYDLNTVLNRSISQHSKYVGLAIPVRNFEKLYNVTTFTDNGVDFKANPLDPGWRYDTSIATTLEKNWGKAATSYVAKMMADIENGTGLKDDKWGDLLAQARSKYAGAVLTTNASVAMKQAASYPTAAAVVGYKALSKALADFRKYGEKTVDMDKLAEYTPLYWYRSKGFVDPELGDIGKEGRHIPKALNWIQGIDMLTTRKLAKAAMYYVEDNNKALVKGTDAWWKEVARVYNRIIEETQPNYTMMQRPQILRSDNALTRALQMFKTQPFQNFNILYDAFGNLAAKSREYKANATEENLQALKSARANAARAVSSQAVSAIVFALMQWAWDAFRGKVKKYRDDDGEKNLLSWLKGMGINVLSSAGGMIPFGSYVLELGETMTDAILKAFKLDPFFDQTFYGMSENASSSVNDMGKAMINMVTKISQTLSGGEITESTVRSLVDSMGDIAQFAGIPVNNVIKLAQSIGRNIYLATEGKYVGGYHALRLTTDPARYSSDYYDLLWKAYKNDKAAYDEVLQMMLDDKSGTFTEKKIKDNFEKRMKEAQGVNNVNDLESRWMAPSQQKTYDEGLADIENTTMFQAATDEQQKALLTKLYNLALDNDAGKKLNEKITGGADFGIDQTEYLLYSLAISMTNPEGGTPTNDEAEAAILMVPGLTPEERSYLWKAAGKSEKSDPFK